MLIVLFERRNSVENWHLKSFWRLSCCLRCHSVFYCFFFIIKFYTITIHSVQNEKICVGQSLKFEINFEFPKKIPIIFNCELKFSKKHSKSRKNPKIFNFMPCFRWPTIYNFPLFLVFIFRQLYSTFQLFAIFPPHIFDENKSVD